MVGDTQRTFVLRVAAFVVPVLVVAALCAVMARDAFVEAGAARKIVAASQLARPLGDLAHELQREHVLAAMFLAGSAEADRPLADQRARTDRKVDAVLTARRELEPKALRGDVRYHLTDLAETLRGDLAEARRPVSAQRPLTFVLVDYRSIVDGVLSVLDGIAERTGDRKLGTRAEAVAAYGHAKASAATEAAVVGAALAAPGPEFPPGLYGRMVTARTEYADYLRTFDHHAVEAQSRSAGLVTASEAQELFSRVSEDLYSSGREATTLTAAGWSLAALEMLADMAEAAGNLADDLADAATEREAAATKRAWTTVLVGGGVLLVWLVGLVDARRRWRPPAATGVAGSGAAGSGDGESGDRESGDAADEPVAAGRRWLPYRVPVPPSMGKSP
jgi:hypothetical protein